MTKKPASKQELSRKERIEAAIKMLKDEGKPEAVGLPGSEEDKYQKPAKEMTKEELENELHTREVEEHMLRKERRDKKASGAVESTLDPSDIIPAKAMSKVAAVLGAGALKKLMPMMAKRKTLREAFEALAKGKAKDAAYKKYYKVHKEVEDFLNEAAGVQGSPGWAERMGKVREEASEALEKALKEKGTKVDIYPPTPPRYKSPAFKAAGERTSERAAARKQAAEEELVKGTGERAKSMAPKKTETIIVRTEKPLSKRELERLENLEEQEALVPALAWRKKAATTRSEGVAAREMSKSEAELLEEAAKLSARSKAATTIAKKNAKKRVPSQRMLKLMEKDK